MGKTAVSETTAETRRASHETTDKNRWEGRVIEALTELGAATALEVLDYVRAHYAPNAEIRNVSARVCELSKAGKIEIASDEDGQPIKKMERYGKRNAVYQLAAPLRAAQVELLDATDPPTVLEVESFYCFYCQRTWAEDYFDNILTSSDPKIGTRLQCKLCATLPQVKQLEATQLPLF